jgi:hypothetical protein
MNRHRVLTFTLAVAGLLGIVTTDAAAQSPRGIQRAGTSGRYQPSRPTVSPYINLFRNDRGPLPNYHLYVRPVLQQQSINAQQGQAVQQLEQGLRQTQATPLGPTGIGGGYRNFSHYYTGLR